MKKLLSTMRIGMALFLAAFSTNLLPSAVALATPVDNPNKVEICHATNSNTNPYVVQEVSKNSVDNENNDLLNGHGDHTGPVWNATLKASGTVWGDIIPPFVNTAGTSFAGQNWTAAGEAIWNNDCNAPVSLTITPGPCVPAGSTTGTASVDVLGSANGTQLLVDGDNYQTITDNTVMPISVTGLTIGTHTFALKKGNDTFGSQQVTIVACPVQPTSVSANVTFDDKCGTANDTFTLEQKEGVVYTVNNSVNTTVGTQTATGTVNVVASASSAAYTLSGTTNFSKEFTDVACEVVLTPATPGVVNAADVCGTANDSYTVPSTVGVDYKIGGNVISAGTYPGVGTVTIVAAAKPTYALTAGYTFTKTFSANPCAVSCPSPSNGGVITQNTPGWALSDEDAEFVDGGVVLSSDNWSGSYIYNTESYPISEALQLEWTTTGTVSGAGGAAIILETAGGQYIHYEPIPYSDDFWTNSAGILPANGGGQGGPYSGSLQDILDTAGDLTIVATYFYFNSAEPNEITLKTLSFNCATYTFDEKEGCDCGDNVVAPVEPEIVQPTCEDPYGRLIGFDYDDDRYSYTNGENEQPLAGPYPADSSVTITAVPSGDYSFGDNQYSWDFDFNEAPVDCASAEIIPPVCVPVGSSQGSFTVRVTNDFGTAKDFRVVVNGDDTEEVTVDANSQKDVTFTGYGLGAHSVKVYMLDDEAEYSRVDVSALLSDRVIEDEEVPMNPIFEGTVTLVQCSGGVLGETDVCPNLDGPQAVVPNGYVKVGDECGVVGGVGGGSSVLGVSAPLPAELPATGNNSRFNPVLVILAALGAYGATYFWQGRQLRRVAENA